MICKNCGKEISESSKFCGYCGAKVTEQPQQSQPEQPQPEVAKEASLQNFISTSQISIHYGRWQKILFRQVSYPSQHQLLL